VWPPKIDIFSGFFGLPKLQLLLAVFSFGRRKTLLLAVFPHWATETSWAVEDN
jgi:hypothetical protein